jgi:hypothetical protein
MGLRAVLVTVTLILLLQARRLPLPAATIPSLVAGADVAMTGPFLSLPRY